MRIVFGWGFSLWAIMKFDYISLSEDQFETLVYYICCEILGEGVRKFSKGPDGGKDAEFHGVANCYPSKNSPWNGKVIIQAKHTNGYNKSFADFDFYSELSRSNILAKELPKIKTLKDNGELDYYMLFANRKLPALTSGKIKKYISCKTGIDEHHIALYCLESMDVFLRRHEHVAENANLEVVDSPMRFDPNDLSNVILSLSENILVHKQQKSNPPVERIAFKDKNKTNNITERYEKYILDTMLPYDNDIKKFLSDPINDKILRSYEEAVSELQGKFKAYSNSYETGDKYLEQMYSSLHAKDGVLARNKQLTRVVLFYMYWNCDLGDKQ